MTSRTQRGCVNVGAEVAPAGSQDLPTLSVVCVFNNPDVLEDCLARSIRATGDETVEFIPVDNRGQVYTTAGAALNHGVSRARNEVVVLVHQDVYLHSLPRLAAAAAHLRDERWGLLGASGVDHDDAYHGQLRDRLGLHGAPAPTPVEVDSLDEVLVMATRETLLANPLSEDPQLDWHAYGVELGLRLRRAGRLVGAVDTAITHNSLTINLVGLERAHERVERLYPDFPLTRTTCGVIGLASRRWRRYPVVRDHGWRVRWLRESRRAALARRLLGHHVVLGELYAEVDHVPYDTDSPLQLFNVDRTGAFLDGTGPGPLEVQRRGRPVVMRTVPGTDALAEGVSVLDPSAHVVVQDLSLEDLTAVPADLWEGRDWLVGLQPQGWWLLAGPAARTLPEHWLRRQAVPLGSPVPVGG